jgi:hypothetical protein
MIDHWFEASTSKDKQGLTVIRLVIATGVQDASTPVARKRAMDALVNYVKESL